MSGGWRRLFAGSAIAALIALTACSDAGSGGTNATIEPNAEDPTPTYEGPGELLTIESTTQAHLDGIAIGAGNIWEEDYTTSVGEVRHGLTALLFISVQADPAENFTVRVHPGQEIAAPGYLLHVVSVVARYVHIAVVELPE